MCIVSRCIDGVRLTGKWKQGKMVKHSINMNPKIGGNVIVDGQGKKELH